VDGRDVKSTAYPTIVEIELVTSVQQLAMRQAELEDDVRRLEGGIARLFEERQRRSDVVVRVARLLRWQRVCVAFAAGAILSRAGHFRMHL
jgi:hypothetical protein